MELRYPDPPLADAVVHLRAWELRDAGCVEEAGSDPRILAHTTVPPRFTEAAGEAFVERQRRRLETGQGVSLAVVAAGTDRAVGLVWLARRPQRHVLGLGYWVVPSARGSGLGTHAVDLATRWALRDLGAARVEAWVEVDNAASQRLLCSVGFVREGTLRAFLDVAVRPRDAIVFSRLTQDPTR